MVVPDGATMAHVDFAAFWQLWTLGGVVVASRAFRLARMFLGR